MLILTEIYLTVNDVQKNFINNFAYYYFSRKEKMRTIARHIDSKRNRCKINRDRCSQEISKKHQCFFIF